MHITTTTMLVIKQTLRTISSNQIHANQNLIHQALLNKFNQIAQKKQRGVWNTENPFLPAWSYTSSPK